MAANNWVDYENTHDMIPNYSNIAFFRTIQISKLVEFGIVLRDKAHYIW